MNFLPEKQPFRLGPGGKKRIELNFWKLPLKEGKKMKRGSLQGRREWEHTHKFFNARPLLKKIVFGSLPF